MIQVDPVPLEANGVRLEPLALSHARRSHEWPEIKSQLHYRLRRNARSEPAC